MKENKKSKKIPGILLCLVMMLSLVPAAAFAAPTEYTVKVSSDGTVTAENQRSEAVSTYYSGQSATITAAEKIASIFPFMGWCVYAGTAPVDLAEFDPDNNETSFTVSGDVSVTALYSGFHTKPVFIAADTVSGEISVGETYASREVQIYLVEVDANGRPEFTDSSFSPVCVTDVSYSSAGTEPFTVTSDNITAGRYRLAYEDSSSPGSGRHVYSDVFEIDFSLTAHTVTFDGNGAAGAPPVMAAQTLGAMITLPANTFTMDGHTFDGWSDGSATYAVGAQYTMPANSVTFTAVWKADSAASPMIEIVDGGDSEWIKGSTTDLRFKSTAEYADFRQVAIDDVVLDTFNYTLEEDGTIVTIKASYLETLSLGEHTIVIVSASGAPSAVFTVKKADADGNAVMWSALLLVGLSGITTAILSGRRKRRKARS